MKNKVIIFAALIAAGAIFYMKRKGKKATRANAEAVKNDFNKRREGNITLGDEFVNWYINNVTASEHDIWAKAFLNPSGVFLPRAEEDWAVINKIASKIYGRKIDVRTDS